MGDNSCCDICESRNSLEYSEIRTYLDDRDFLKHLEDVLDPKPVVRNKSEPVTFKNTHHKIMVRCSENSGMKNPVPLQLYKLDGCKKLKEYLYGNNEAIRGLGKRQKHRHVQQILENIEKLDLNKGLTESNYVALFHTSLWMEEDYAKKELQNHNQRGVKLVTRAQNGRPPLYCIDVYGLADGRPPVKYNDFVHIHKENHVLVDEETNSTKYHVYESRVKDLETEKDEIYVAPHAAKFEYQVAEKVGIEFKLNRRPYQLSHRALDQLKKDTPLFRTLFPEKGPRPRQPNQLRQDELEFVNKKILDDIKQKQAIKSILNKSSGSAPFILIGPPGTGKTATLIEAIYQIWKKSTSELPKICICAPSNPAVDVIVKRLLGRDGLEDTSPIPPPGLRENVIRVYAITAERDEILQDCSMNELNLEELREKRIIAATTLTAGWLVDKGFGKNWFDYIFIDEAGQSTEPSILVPIAGFLHDKCHLVLAGDPKQLGPVVTCPLAKALGLDVSLMERLKSNKGESVYRRKTNRHSFEFTTTLNNNYRSHPKIIEIPDKYLYDGRLKVSGEQQRIYCASNSDWEQLSKVGIKRHPVIFYGVAGIQRKSGYSPSSFNVKEIIVMKNHIEDLLGRELSGVTIEQNHIGIISPYRTQVEMIKKYLNHRKWNGIRAGSIESFQGSEKLIIIISTVRTKKEGSHFLRNERRFNVAITRAMALLIVIGDPEVLHMKVNRKPNYWRKLIDDCYQQHSCKGKLPRELQRNG